MTLIARFISLLLTPILILGPISAQTLVIPPVAPSEAGHSPALQLRLVEGESTETLVGSRTLKGFLIEVADSMGAAVPEAAVSFRLPDTDPTGRFADGTHAAVVYTDQTGRAKINGIQWNAAPGVVTIRVTATRSTAHAGILIQQTLTRLSTRALAPAVSQTPTDTLPAAAAQLPFAPSINRQPLAQAIPPGQPATVAPPLEAPRPAQNQEPAVSVTSASPAESKHSSKTKWIILAAVAAAAGGAGVAMMGKKSIASNPTAPGISIGPPTVSVGGGH
ncbi:MAG: hypothetical protein ACR2IV_23260 [Bryobacteraceae bacterium]